jgi:nitrous oxide reductase accessory protein NosL
MRGLFKKPLKYSLCRRRPASSVFNALDPGLRRHNGKGINQTFPGLLIVCLLAGCSGEDVTGPGEVRWDRETCSRCAMAVGDRHYAAQVRGAPAGERTRVYTFDDIGCAVVWLDQQPWKDDVRTELWVTDHLNGEWIDARLASYVTGRVTPMDYGLGAQREALPGSMDFTRARKHIFLVDESKHSHGGGYQHPASGE